MARSNPTRTPAGFLTFISGLVLLGLVALAISLWVRSTGAPDEVAAKRAAARIEARQKMEEAHTLQATTLGWTDKAKGVAHVPVQDAMALALVELKAKKVAASTVKVEPPLPIFVPDPKSTEPAPMALPSSPQGSDTVRFDLATVATAMVAPAASPAPLAPAPPALQPASPAPVTPPAPAPAASAPSPAPAPVQAPAPPPAVPPASAPAAPVQPSPSAPPTSAPVNLTPQLSPVTPPPAP